MIRRKRSLSETSARGFSFDLVSRRKDNGGDTSKPLRSPLELLTQSEPAPKTESAEPAVVERAEVEPTPIRQEPFLLSNPEPPAPMPDVEPVPAILRDPEPEPSVMPEPDPEPMFVQEDPASAIESMAEQPAVEPIATPAPTPTAPRRGARVKTTFLGFERSDGRIEDILAGGQTSDTSKATSEVKFPVGWLVVIGGPGRGTSITLQAGVSQIGRGDDQTIQLDHGDNGISRSNHAAIAFDDEERKFFLGHGGKANIVRLNGKPVLSTEEIVDGDEIRISETTLRFIALCGEKFTWAEED